MTAELVIRAVGRCAPQGSKRHVGGGRMVEMSKLLPQWRKDVERACTTAIRAWEAGSTLPWLPLDGPLRFEAIFLLARPARPMNPDYPIGPPDSSKLLRAVEDCLTRAGVVHDDARFVSHVFDKRWCEGDQAPGARIVIRALSDQLVSEGPK